ncbi:zinc finger, CCHC-type containing protein, partial [Tanacetum coccineum]
MDCRVKKNNAGNTFGLDKDLRILIHHKIDAFLHVDWTLGVIVTGGLRIVAGLRLFICSKDVDSSIWHARLGHVHYKRMLAMSKDNLVLEFNITLEK